MPYVVDVGNMLTTQQIACKFRQKWDSKKTDNTVHGKLDINASFSNRFPFQVLLGWHNKLNQAETLQVKFDTKPDGELLGLIKYKSKELQMTSYIGALKMDQFMGVVFGLSHPNFAAGFKLDKSGILLSIPSQVY